MFIICCSGGHHFQPSQLNCLWSLWSFSHLGREIRGGPDLLTADQGSGCGPSAMAFTFSNASRGIAIGMRKGLGLAKRAERTGKIKDGGAGAEIETTATTLIDI